MKEYKQKIKTIFNGATWVNDETGDIMFIVVDNITHNLERVACCSNKITIEKCSAEYALNELTAMGYHYVKDKY